jgi:hypothetical protein
LNPQAFQKRTLPLKPEIHEAFNGPFIHSIDLPGLGIRKAIGHENGF